MRLSVYLLFILFVMLAAENSMADLDPAVVRIRMQKDLDVFPQVQNATIKKIAPDLWGLRGDSLVYDTKKLPRNNFIIKKENGKFDIIGVIGFNEYLSGVVANEMPASWPMEALKSQAVVARSYALARINERKNKVFQLESDQFDQVYSSVATLRTKQAVASTEGVVLQTPQGEVLKAYYHADCGGQTVPASEVWGDATFDVGTAKDPWCLMRKSNQWSFEMAKDEFFKTLGFVPKNENRTDYYSNKNQQIAILDQFFSVQKLRETFGFFKIKSAPDKVEMGAKLVKITGQGFGHGAGLCQWGTLAQAKLGRDYIQVLSHYYPKAKIIHNSYKLSLNLPLNLPYKTVSN